MPYEMLCLISSKIGEKEVPLITGKIEEIIKNLKGEVSYIKNLGEKKLAYSIKHEMTAYSFVFNFKSEAGVLKKIEEKLKNISEVLRFQIIKISEAKKKEKRERKIKLVRKIKESSKEEKIDLKLLEEKIDKILENT